MSDYNGVLKRLAAYRKRLGMTQEQIAGKINISQEQYSYLENGITKITDRDLKGLFELGWNIDYIITGTEDCDGESKLEGVFDGFCDEAGKDFAMKLCAEIMIEKAEKCRLAEKEDGLRETLVLLQDMVEAWQHFSMSRHVRKKLRISQLIMAEKLGVGIKKYREIEREIRYPDAEMLLSFYEMSGYPPVLFLELQDRRMLVLGRVWNAFEEKEREELLGFIEYMKRIL